MIKNNLSGMNYLKDEYFDKNERLFAGNLWCNILKQEVARWDNKKYFNILPQFSRLKLEIFYKTLKLGSKIYNPSKGKCNVMWVSEISNKEFLYKSQPYNLVVTDARLSSHSLKQLFFTPNISLNPIYPCYNSLYSGIIDENELLIQDGLNELEKIFKRVNPDIITLHDDIPN